MELVINEAGETVVATLGGRIEGSDDAESLRITLDKSVSSSTKALLVDCEELAYINSTGLRSIAYLVNRTREAGIRFFLCGPSDSVYEVLTMSGFDQIVEIAESVEEAKWMLET